MTQTAPLTREQIINEPVGKRLDAWVAKYVKFIGHTHPVEEVMQWCANYSSDHSDAWKMEASFEEHTLIREDYAIELHNVLGLMLHEPTTLGNVYQIAHATPEQRCKAALLAVLDL